MVNKDNLSILHDNKLYTLDCWSKQEDATVAEYVVLITDHISVKIAKKGIGDMTWDEAMKHDLPDSTEGHEIGLNYDKLKEALELIGGNPIEGWHWTKSEYTSNRRWIYGGTYGYLNHENKNLTLSVREITKYKV